MRLLRQRGHRIVALTRSELATSAVPPWSDVQARLAARRANGGCGPAADMARHACGTAARRRFLPRVSMRFHHGHPHHAAGGRRRGVRAEPALPRLLRRRQLRRCRDRHLPPGTGRRRCEGWLAGHELLHACGAGLHGTPRPAATVALPAAGLPRCHATPPVLPVPRAVQVPEWMTSTSAPVLYYEQVGIGLQQAACGWGRPGAICCGSSGRRPGAPLPPPAVVPPSRLLPRPARAAGPRVAVWRPRQVPRGGGLRRPGPAVPHGHAPACGGGSRLRWAPPRFPRLPAWAESGRPAGVQSCLDRAGCKHLATAPSGARPARLPTAWLAAPAPRAAEAVQSIICREFGRSSLLVHNGIDCGRFRPGPRDAAALAAHTKLLGPPNGQVRCQSRGREPGGGGGASQRRPRLRAGWGPASASLPMPSLAPACAGLFSGRHACLAALRRTHPCLTAGRPLPCRRLARMASPCPPSCWWATLR